ncbi:cytochrome P450 [Nostoc sp. FACHB-892]|jgi:cytochrome P450|uniref:cytochrome P450 n=1 Tax=Nostoc sp. FACHB-892 TaxID=2692843 RepID=UPI001688E9DB|nr:cytochrome P450 [Nostoc sp. FACHB-892]MBD2731354.1 cytochrome P450 [Nostoc sp. FACHB-892]MBW4454762.1 cytochrome P450 [Nostoc indistinguendum CM1-VF10]
MTRLTENQSKNTTSLPDGPQSPGFLQIIQKIFYYLEYLDAARERYGDIFTMRSPGFPPTVILSDPQAIQEVFTADLSLFDTGTKILQPLLGEYSLIQLDGLPHQRRRKLLMPPFHGERMRTYAELICDITEQVMSQWTLGKPFCVRSSMQEITLRVILRAVFGIDQGERFEQLRQLLGSWLDSFNSPLRSSFLLVKFLQKDLGAWSPWGRFLRQKQQIDALLIAEIRERQTQPNSSREDILSLMISARDEEGQPMAEEELRDDLMTLLFAGHETTASALAWAFYWIHHLPEVREKLMSELDTLSPDLDPSAIAKLPYLNAVCSETLRIYPVALFSFSRTVKSPLELMGYQLEPGTVLAPCIYLTHQNASIYPEPKRFKPERFLERQFSPYEYLPFGGGNRRCLGSALALFEMKLVLATVLSRANLVLADKRPVRSVRRGFTFTPSDGVRMVMTGSR